MASFIDAVGESVNRAACVILGDFAARLEVLNYVLDPLATAPSYNGAAATYAARCGLPLPPSFNGSAPFTGGQCPGVLYDVTVTYTVIRGIVSFPPGEPENKSAVRRLAGAINGVRVVNDPGVTQLFIRHAGIEAGVESIGLATPGNARIENAVIVSAIRVDGNPDNCGNPPVTPPVYTPGSNTYNTNVTYNDNEGTEVTIPVVIALGYATFNANAEVTIPVELNFELNPELNFNAEFNFNTGEVTPDLRNPSAPRPPSCTDPNGFEPDPTIPAPPPEIPDAENPDTEPDEPIEREEIINAAIVTVGNPGENESVIFQDDNPDIYVPALGYIQFKIRVGASSAWTGDIPIKCKRQFVPCPWPLGAVDVRGTGRYENEITVTPVKSRVQLINPFPE